VKKKERGYNITTKMDDVDVRNINIQDCLIGSRHNINKSMIIKEGCLDIHKSSPE